MLGTRSAATMALALLYIAVSACSSSSGSPGGSGATTLPDSTARSGTPDATQSAQTEAVAFVSTYVRMLDDLRADPARPLDDIYEVAIAPEATAEASAVGQLRSRGYRQTGLSQVVSASLGGAVSTAKGSAGSSPAAPSVIVNACLDVGSVGAVNKAGKSVVPPGRPRYLIEELTLVNPRYPNAASWRVRNAGNRQARSCSG